MPTSGGQILLIVTGLLGVTLTSAWITLQLLDYWDPSAAGSGPNASFPNLIHITDATYGMSCRGFTVAPGQANKVKEGNATHVVARICDKAIDDCRFYFNVGDVGDPAPGCGKDLSVSWRCANDQKVHGLRVPPEADAKQVWIVCPRR